MREFKFEYVRDVMAGLNWTWRFEAVPTVAELMAEAKRLLLEAYDECHDSGEDDCWIETGGLRAAYHMERGFKLDFILESWDTFP